METYRKILLVVLLVLACQLNAVAQDYKNMNLHFVYIDHEPTTPVSQLCQRIRTLRDDAIEVEDALIVYLSDGKHPLLSYTNLQDPSGRNLDKNEAFVEVIAALQDANSHEVIAQEDRKNILRLFDKYNFIDENGEFIFSSVTMDFYIGPNFWALGNNEKIISHLFAAFDVNSLPKEKFTFSVFKPKGQSLEYPAGMPFGDNNIDGINQVIRIFEY